MISTDTFGLERTPSPPSPERQYVRTFRVFQHAGRFQQGAVKRRAVVPGELDQPGFGDKAAELDQLAGAFAPVHAPGSRVGSCTSGLKPMPSRRRPARR